MPGNSDIEYVIKKYGTVVYGIICSRIRNRSEADDVYQEVFLLYYTKELHFDDEAARRSWLIRTAINMTRSANSSAWNRYLDGGELDTENVPCDDRTPREREVWNAVCGLEDKYRLPLVLHYFNGIPVGEAAELLDMKENTFKSRLMRARKKLEKELG